jgi:hypothetical protein
MTIEQTRAEVDRLRARFVSDPRTHALALADQLNRLSLDVAMRGDHDASADCNLEAVGVLTAHLDPLVLPPGEEFRYAGIVAGVAAGLLIDNRADLALPLLDRAVDAHARLAHLAGDAIVQPTFDPPPPPPDPVEEAQHEAFRRAIDNAPRPPSPYADDHPPVPFETPPGAFARPNRGWLQPTDWSSVYWQLLCARARALATLGEKERALDDAVAALAINLLGTELDYARLVASADAGLRTASLLVEGVEPEEGPLGW